MFSVVIELCVESLLGPRSDLNQVGRKGSQGKEELVVGTSKSSYQFKINLTCYVYLNKSILPPILGI